MRVKIAIGLFVLVVGCFLWTAYNGFKSTAQKSDDLFNKLIKAMEEDSINKEVNKEVLSLIPLERVYSRLILGMERQEALNIVDEEYPINDNAKSYSVSRNRNADGEYVWRWEWKNEIDSGATESATLTITFTREGDCVMCKIADAVYEYKNNSEAVRKGLRIDSPI